MALGFRMLVASFHARFKELLFVSIALVLVAAFLNFDRSGLIPICVEPADLVTNHDHATGKNRKK